MTYDKKVRTYANELTKSHTRGNDITILLKEEDRRIVIDVLRECGSTTTFAQRTTEFKRKKGKSNDWKCNGKND